MMMQLIVKQNQLLTPLSPDKSVYRLILEPDSLNLPLEPFNYQPGDWVTLQVANHPDLVNLLLEKLALSGEEPLSLRHSDATNVRTALLNALEITQLNPAILNKIQRQFGLEAWPDRQAMQDYAQSRDIVDLLEAFPFLQTLGVAFLALLSPLAPRYYSIASCQTDECTVAIVYKKVVYEREGRKRQGVATRFLADLQPGDKVVGELKANPNFKLPDNPQTPIIMIGAGTGIAPFMGFMQQRIAQQATGTNLLFFGETYQAWSFLFENDLKQWQAQQQLQLFTAFSRDQAQKIYVQEVVAQQQKGIVALIEQGAVIYICGAQKTLAKGVERVLTRLLQENFAGEGLDWAALKAAKRIQMDVY